LAFRLALHQTPEIDKETSMKRTITILSLVFVLTVAAFAQVAPTPQPKPEHLSKQQLNTLIATAKTPAEHERIAQYYKAKAVDYLAQAKEHEAMVAAYKANSSLSNDKNQASTISHCEYFVTTFKALADNSQEMATLHERMAKEAPEKLNPTGK
jgi:Na+-transporting NADH:ubiquinone oxidoreductase subunit NqrC